MIYILIIIISYLLGSINSSIIVSRKVAGVDIREKGSKNAGATNTLRTLGKGPAVIVLVCDILKGIIAILIARLLANITGQNETLAIQFAAFFAVLGHTFPVYFKFKGGKGIATGIGVLFLINWKIALICVIYGVIMMLITRMVSVGSISAAILFPLLTLLVDTGYMVGGIFRFTIFGILLAALIIFNHRENLKRLANGTENRISFKRKAEESE